MEGQNNVINFRWERFKHRVKHAVYNIKQSFIDFFGGESKSSTNPYKKKGAKAIMRKRRLKNV